jgi:hypothetical protein
MPTNIMHLFELLIFFLSLLLFCFGVGGEGVTWRVELCSVQKLEGGKVFVIHSSLSF